MPAHTISARTVGRYRVEPAQEAPRGLLVGFHGYGQDDTAMMEELQRLPGHERWMKASLMALHRFDHTKTGRVIASWMTKLDRELAIADNPSFEISRIEIDRPGPHYTLDTLEAISEQYPNADITPIIGGDSLRDLPKWHKPRELLFASHWVGVMRRPGEQPNLEKLEAELPGISSKIHYVDAPLLEIASREIRSRIANHQPFRYYVPLSVCEYIEQHHLYRQSEIVNRKL